MQRLDLCRRVRGQQLSASCLRGNHKTDCRQCCIRGLQHSGDVGCVGAAPQPVVQTLEHEHRVGSNLGLDNTDPPMPVDGQEVNESRLLRRRPPRGKFPLPMVQTKVCGPQQ